MRRYAIKTNDPSWAGVSDQWYTPRPVGDRLTVGQAYTYIGFVRACVDRIADSMISIPYKIEMGERNVTEQYELIDQWETLNLIATYFTVFGAYYAIPRRIGNRVKLDLLFPPAVTHFYNANGELEYFERTGVTNGQRRFSPDELVWKWEQNMISERGPGQSILVGALIDADLIRGGQEFSYYWYIRGGGLRAWFLPGKPPEQEQLRFKETIRAVTWGLRKMWDTVILNQGVTTEDIGGDPKSGTVSEITKDAEARIMASLGVPSSLLFDDSANRATAEQSARNLITNKTLPLLRRVITPINQKVWEPQGVKFTPQPELAQEFQSQAVETSAGVIALKDAGLVSPTQAQRMLNLPITPIRVARPSTPSPQPTPTAPITPQSAVASLDLSAWQRKAINALEKGRPASVAFTSDSIPADEHARIGEALKLCKTPDEVKAVFTQSQPVSEIARLAEALENATKAVTR